MVADNSLKTSRKEAGSSPESLYDDRVETILLGIDDNCVYGGDHARCVVD